MTDLKKTQKFWYQNIDKNFELAIYYGFKPETKIKPETNDIKLAEKIIKSEKKLLPEKYLRNTRDLIAFLNRHLATGLEKNPNPILSIFEEDAGGQNKKTKKIFLEIIGSHSGFADILILKTALEILKINGIKKPKIYINSVGDRDSINRFGREFQNYYRKKISKLTTSCKNLLRTDPFAVLNCEHEQCQKIANESPVPFGFLSENSRRHFKEVLEDLENTGINYEIDEKMIIGKTFSCHTVFVIKDEKNKIVAEGGRYNTLIRKMGYRREIPAVGITLEIPQSKKIKKINLSYPKIFFVQMGNKAKMKSLEIINILHKIKIPMMQSLIKDKLGSQLNLVEKYRTPFVLLIGQQESLENTIILRNVRTREQHIIPIDILETEIKKYL